MIYIKIYFTSTNPFNGSYYYIIIILNFSDMLIKNSIEIFVISRRIRKFAQFCPLAHSQHRIHIVKSNRKGRFEKEGSKSFIKWIIYVSPENSNFPSEQRCIQIFVTPCLHNKSFMSLLYDAPSWRLTSFSDNFFFSPSIIFAFCFFFFFLNSAQKINLSTLLLNNHIHFVLISQNAHSFVVTN